MKITIFRNDERVEERSRWILVFTIVLWIIAAFLFGYLASTAVNHYRDACYHPVTPPMKVFVNECMSEGYDFGQCYYAYVDAVEHGSVMLEMPKTWV